MEFLDMCSKTLNRSFHNSLSANKLGLNELLCNEQRPTITSIDSNMSESKSICLMSCFHLNVAA